MRFVRSPYLVQRTFNGLVWRMPTKEKIIYLSFDDGPIPGITPWVLDLLKQHQAKATFFCVGDNVEKNKDVFQRIIAEGHTVGNHTYNHLNGWKTQTEHYVDNVKKCDALIKSTLLRPPYGKFTLKQYKRLKHQYRFIMWDVLSYDFDKDLSPTNCYAGVIKKIRPGSIILFHDSIKAEENMKYTLPKVLETFSKKGFLFKRIEQV